MGRSVCAFVLFAVLALGAAHPAAAEDPMPRHGVGVPKAILRTETPEPVRTVPAEVEPSKSQFGSDHRGGEHRAGLRGGVLRRGPSVDGYVLRGREPRRSGLSRDRSPR